MAFQNLYPATELVSANCGITFSKSCASKPLHVLYLEYKKALYEAFDSDSPVVIEAVVNNYYYEDL